MSHDAPQLVDRILKRLRSEDLPTFRAGGRAVALQAIEHRGDLVRALRGALAELGDDALDDRRRGYVDALEDVLLAAEASLEPREQETRARDALARNPALRTALVTFVAGPQTPRNIADAIGKSSATGTRYVQELRALELVTEIIAQDGRERRHRLTELGRRLVDAEATTTTSSTSPGGETEALVDELVLDPLTGTWTPDVLRRKLSGPDLERESLAVIDVVMRTAPASFQLADKSAKQIASKLHAVVGPGAMISRYEHVKFVVAATNTRAVDLEREIRRAVQPLDVAVTSVDVSQAKRILQRAVEDDEQVVATVGMSLPRR